MDVLLGSDALVRKSGITATSEKVSTGGFDTGKTETPITPVMLGDEKVTSGSQTAVRWAIFASAIKYPTVARANRIRCMLSASRKSDLDYAIEKFTLVEVAGSSKLAS